jgi:hypothetical protein
VAPRTIFCPHCGLALTIDDSQGGTVVGYAPAEWRRLCKYPDLGSPALCLLQGSGSGGSGSGQNARPTH